MLKWQGFKCFIVLYMHLRVYSYVIYELPKGTLKINYYQLMSDFSTIKV